MRNTSQRLLPTKYLKWFFFVSSIVFFVEVKKMWRQAVFGKMSKSSHFFLGGRYIICSKQDDQQNSPLEMGLILVFTKYPSGGCFETPHKCASWQAHTRVSFHAGLINLLKELSHCDCRHGLRCIALYHWSLGPYGCYKCLLDTPSAGLGAKLLFWKLWSLIDAPKTQPRRK